MHGTYQTDYKLLGFRQLNIEILELKKVHVYRSVIDSFSEWALQKRNELMSIKTFYIFEYVYMYNSL